MTYLTIDNVDVSKYVNSLKVATNHNYSAQTNASGGMVVDYLSKKITVEVGFIPMDSAEANNILKLVRDKIEAEIQFMQPGLNTTTKIKCILPENEIEFYTIRQGNIKLNTFTLTFIEL